MQKILIYVMLCLSRRKFCVLSFYASSRKKKNSEKKKKERILYYFCRFSLGEKIIFTSLIFLLFSFFIFSFIFFIAFARFSKVYVLKHFFFLIALKCILRLFFHDPECTFVCTVLCKTSYSSTSNFTRDSSGTFV